MESLLNTLEHASGLSGIGKRFSSVLDNRELALAIWLFAFLVYGDLSKRIRSSLASIVRTLLHPKLLSVIGCMAIYLGGVVYLLSLVKMWTRDLISETLFWFLGTAFVLFFRFDQASRDPMFFRHTFVSVLKFTVVIEFVINLYPAHLIVELLLVPVFVILGGMMALAASRDEYKQVKGAVEFLLALIGIAMLSYTVAKIVDDPQSFATLDNLREWLLPIILTIAFVAFSYVVAVFIAYDSLFARLQLRDGDLAGYAKRQVFRKALLRLRNIRRFSIGYPKELMEASGRSDIDRAVRAISRRSN